MASSKGTVPLSELLVLPYWVGPAPLLVLELFWLVALAGASVGSPRVAAALRRRPPASRERRARRLARGPAGGPPG